MGAGVAKLYQNLSLPVHTPGGTDPESRTTLCKT